MDNELESLRIYNAYLRCIGEAKGRPWSKRKSLEGLDKAKAMDLARLERFFAQHRHIDPYDFFRASFVETEEAFLPLSHFNTRKAVAAYSRYEKRLNRMDADSDEVVESFVKGVQFVYNFTRGEGRNFKDYPSMHTDAGAPWFMVHLKEQKISLYHLHFFGVPFEAVPRDYMEIIMENFEDAFVLTRMKYLNSNRLRELGEKIHARLG